MELPAVVERRLQVTSIMATARNRAHTAAYAGVNSYIADAADAMYSCVWPHARDSTASRQLSEVRHVPTLPVLRLLTTLEPEC